MSKRNAAICLIAIASALGVAAFITLMIQLPTTANVFCTNSSFYYFDIPPAAGTLGNYSRVSIQRSQDVVQVTMQGLFFYSQPFDSSRGWVSGEGYPTIGFIGVDTDCIPPFKGHPHSIPEFDALTCISATNRPLVFPPGYIFSSVDSGPLAPPAIQLLDGQVGPVACIAHLPDPDVNVVYRRVDLNPEWFMIAQSWQPFGWDVQFTYHTSASSRWHVPDRCKTSFRDYCTVNPS